MTTGIKTTSLPQTIERFKNWESEDGFKYEWFDGELIKFTGLKSSELYIYFNLSNLFAAKQLLENGCLVCRQEVEFSKSQIRLPDIAYFSNEQAVSMREGVDEIPQFAVEIISKNDNFNNVEAKLEEYFKYGVEVVWIIIPELKKVKVYNSLKENKNCFADDVCSAAPVLPAFEMTVSQVFA